MDYNKEAIKLHKEKKGKIEVVSKVALKNKDDLSTAYTPGVAEPCREIAKDKKKVYDYTSKGNMVAVVTDGSAVLGLGNIGAEAALPVMEGKAVLFKEFGNVDAFPICLDTQDTEEIIKAVKQIAPVFGGINLEDISAPRCFEIEERLKKELDIPVFHDDQHGTAMVVLAGLINSLKIVGKKKEDIKVAISGAGSAGIAIAKILLKYGVEHMVLVDSKGAIYSCRDHLNLAKKELATITNAKCNNTVFQDGERCKVCVRGGLSEALKGRDVFIGVSAGGIVTEEMIKGMNKDAIIFAMANPTPEIMPDLAKKAGARIVATGRSDFPNQINNVLVFPNLFRGVLDAKAKEITEEMKVNVAKALANSVDNISEDKIIPSPFDKGYKKAIIEAVKASV